MTSWLHWMGNQYYTIESFVEEAREHGVSRRVPANVLKKMAWGEKVFLITREKNKVRPVIFGYFVIDRLQGINIDELPEDIKVKVVDAGPVALVKRGCGYLVEGGVYAYTDAGIEQLADYADDKDVFARGGLILLPEPYPELTHVVPFRGFRPFDEEAFWGDLEKAKGNGRPKLDSFYYQ